MPIDLEERRKRLHASEWAAAIGESVFPGNTPMRIWSEKLHLLPDRVFPPALQRRRDFQALVLKWYEEDSLAKCPEPLMLVPNEDDAWQVGPDEWIAATCDAMVSEPVEPPCYVWCLGVEAKTTRSFEDWGESGVIDVGDHERIPWDYSVQCRILMMVYEVDRWDLAAYCLFKDETRYYTILHDPAEEARLLTKGKALWFDHVLPQIAPPVSADPADAEVIAATQEEEAGKVIASTGELEECVERYWKLKLQIEMLEGFEEKPPAVEQ